MRGQAIAGIQERSKRFLLRCTGAGTQAHDIFVNTPPRVAYTVHKTVLTPWQMGSSPETLERH